MLIPTVTRTVQNMLGSMLRELINHLQYRRGISLCHFHVLGRLKKALNGRRLGSGKDVKVAVVLSPRSSGTFFVERIHRFVCQRDGGQKTLDTGQDPSPTSLET
jgi:hypothetical protein